MFTQFGGEWTPKPKKLQPLKHFWGRTYNGYKIIIMKLTCNLQLSTKNFFHPSTIYDLILCNVFSKFVVTEDCPRSDMKQFV